MRKRDKTKDLLFNAIDYVVMIVIIIGIVVILGYKFELLFNKGKADDQVAQTKETTTEVNITSSDIENKSNSENSGEATDNQNDTNAEANNDVNSNETTDEKPDENSNEIIISNPNETPEEKTDTNETTETSSESGQQNTPPKAGGEDVKVNIPAGSLPGAMGDILANAGLVGSKKEFVDKAVELKLDRSLKSGEFTFKKGQSLEEIIRTISK